MIGWQFAFIHIEDPPVFDILFRIADLHGMPA